MHKRSLPADRCAVFPILGATQLKVPFFRVVRAAAMMAVPALAVRASSANQPAGELQVWLPLERK
jgi:hypothetical protein